ncbi:Holliday junction branch migration protein RuvA [Bdellovibrio bacteriovorus]|uniref:Holliday junction branch migration complex subunit RuvA n=1 Tax=Bdellovibrio bacteriovorus TaxID=959 RepID=A0A1Z3N757_BDEBC|nr:Holliday junction branch migration protein RuvA [Bdellovibrio bacteriovorus]ASD63304.1 Holliday junction branch migration protein RuvA [Bdellovibrio bacteriovorus]
MIGYLRGKIIEVMNDSALIDVSGVGYEIHASSNTLGDLQTLLGNDIIVWIHTHVREDALQLFGFHDKEEKNLFLSLLKVNGVGPKMALSILSGGRPAQIHEMIEAGNAKALSGLPKVGKKTAEQIILTLKGKLVSIEEGGVVAKAKSVAHTQITSALLNLGYKSQLVDQFVSSLPADIAVEDGIRKGFQTLSGGLS